MHGDAAGRVLGDRVRLDERVESLDDLDADAIVVAVPPRESARLLGEPDPRSRTRRSSACISGSTGGCSRRRSRRCSAPTRTGSSTAARSPGHEPERGQYLTVVSSGVPELLEVRGRELVERIAAQLTERLGAAELLWSRVSREPYATIALRPGRRCVPGVETSRPDVVRAGAWTDTGWPATMESAVRSGRAAAQHVLSTVACKSVRHDCATAELTALD